MIKDVDIAGLIRGEYMGMNYYLHLDECDKCHRPAKKIHIGKSSFGWTFSFRGYKFPLFDDEPYAVHYEKDWLPYLENAIKNLCSKIRNEDGEEIGLDEFKHLVESKKSEENNHTLRCRESHSDHARDCWLDNDGHSFTGCEFS